MNYRLFLPQFQYERKYRSELIDILKPFYKGENFPDAERVKMYGISEQELLFTNTVSEADVLLLPYSWNHYRYQHMMDEAKKIVEQAAKHNKPVLSHLTGDYGVRVPQTANLYILRANGFRSKVNRRHWGKPVFLKHPSRTLNDLQLEFTPLPKPELPAVGFCGNADNSFWILIKKDLGIWKRHLAFRSGLSPIEDYTIKNYTRLRKKSLNLLKKHSDILDDFIIRTQYNYTDKKDPDQARREFYQNIQNNPYTFCVRGCGNYSKRLYEVMSMGRIPVLVDTDCILPFDGQGIDWTKQAVYVKEKDMKKLPQALLDFHSDLHPDDFTQRQMENYRIWQSHLTLGNYYKKVLELILSERKSSNYE